MRRQIQRQMPRQNRWQPTLDEPRNPPEMGPRGPASFPTLSATAAGGLVSSLEIDQFLLAPRVLRAGLPPKLAGSEKVRNKRFYTPPFGGKNGMFCYPPPKSFASRRSAKLRRLKSAKICQGTRPGYPTFSATANPTANAPANPTAKPMAADSRWARKSAGNGACQFSYPFCYGSERPRLLFGN